MSNLIVLLLLQVVSADVISEIRKVQAETKESGDRPEMIGLDFETFQSNLISMSSQHRLEFELSQTNNFIEQFG